MSQLINRNKKACNCGGGGGGGGGSDQSFCMRPIDCIVKLTVR